MRHIRIAWRRLRIRLANFIFPREFTLDYEKVALEVTRIQDKKYLQRTRRRIAP